MTFYISELFLCESSPKMFIYSPKNTSTHDLRRSVAKSRSENGKQISDALNSSGS